MMLLFLGDLGGAEVMLLSLLVFGVPFALLLWWLVRPKKPPVSLHQNGSSVADELQKLQTLYAQGVLTEAEFQAQKRRLLKQLS